MFPDATSQDQYASWRVDTCPSSFPVSLPARNAQLPSTSLETYGSSDALRLLASVVDRPRPDKTTFKTVVDQDHGDHDH